MLLSAPWAQQKDTLELESWSIYHIINDPSYSGEEATGQEPQVLAPVNLSVGGMLLPSKG